MIRTLAGLVLLFVAACAHAQPAGSGAVDGLVVAQPFDIEGERSRIGQERAREEARSRKEDAACYARFAVTDCLREVRLRRREVMDRLRRQEVAVNDAERRQKAQDTMNRIKGAAQRARDESASRQLQEQASRQQREERAGSQAATATIAKPASAPGKSQKKPTELGRTEGEAAKEQQRYSDKLRQAQEHRADREKSNKEKSLNPAKPLPQAP